MYAFKTKKKDGEFFEKKTCKGVKKSAKSRLEFAAFKKSVMEPHKQIIEQTIIRSRKHKLSTVKQIKLAFNSFDDKVSIILH